VKRLGVAVIVLSCSANAWADEARSGESDELQAMLDCSVGGKGLSPSLPNKIAGHVTCVIQLDGFSLDGLVAEAWISQEGVAGERRAGTAVARGDDADDEIRFDPFVRGVDVRPCRAFVVHARVLVEDEVAWSTDLPVETKCKKAKKVKAKLSCTFVASDGTVYAWPGSGAKAKPQLDDTLACWVKSGKSGLFAIIGGHSEALFQDDDDKKWSSAQMLEPELDFVTCEPFTVKASLENADGQVVWTGKQAFAQRC
jgi:hypothetical protein